MTKRTRKIGGVQVNLIAEFDIDEGARTDLALEANEYAPSPSANYESWLLLEPIPVPAPAPAGRCQRLECTLTVAMDGAFVRRCVSFGLWHEP